MFLHGDHVRVIGLPASASLLPPETRLLFEAAVGRILRVDDVDAQTGFLALNIHADGSQADDWCQHTIWLEPAFADLVSRSTARPALP
jgi:hypothetical protein